MTQKSFEEIQEYYASQRDVIKEVRVETELKSEGDERGTIKAVFSVFNELDSDGDVVLPTALTDGQKVPMVWAHRWDQPIGKGRVEVQEDRAIFSGRFFLDTEDGEQAYLKVKNMEDLQEWSWGFRILDYDIEEDEDSKWGYRRVIKKADLFEVSPVLVGANRNTRTLSVKGDAVTITTEEISGDLSLDLTVQVDDNSNIKEGEEYTLILKTENGDEEFPISRELAKALITVVSQEAIETPSEDITHEALKEVARFEMLRNQMLRGER